MKSVNDTILRILPMIDLLVIKVVDESGEAPRLVLHRKRQSRNIPDKHCVKVSRHFQVVTSTQGLEITQNRSTCQNFDAGLSQLDLPRQKTNSRLSGQRKLQMTPLVHLEHYRLN